MPSEECCELLVVDISSTKLLQPHATEERKVSQPRAIMRWCLEPDQVHQGFRTRKIAGVKRQVDLARQKIRRESFWRKSTCERNGKLSPSRGIVGLAVVKI